MSLKLAEKHLIRQCVESVPHDHISLISKQLNLSYLPSLLTFVAEESETSRHIQFYLIWTKSLLYSHGSYLKSESKQVMPVLNLLIKNLTRKSEDLSRICDYNKYSIKYLIGLKDMTSKDSNVDGEEDMEVDGEVRDVTNQSDSDEDMTELAAKWTDDDEDDDNENDEDSEDDD